MISPASRVVANELGMTAFLAVLDHEYAVTLVSVEPRAAIAAVAQRPGTRHSQAAGAVTGPRCGPSARCWSTTQSSTWLGSPT